MSDKLTPAQIKRDEFLRNLAIDPGEALRHWKRLKPGEPLVVITYMAMYYGLEFATHFKTEANKRKRPDLVIEVTNLPSVTPASLAKRGYKLQRVLRGLTDMQIWVHPTGREVWLIPPAKATPPAPVSPPPPPLHPDVEEVKTYAGEYTKRKNEMIRNARNIEARRGSLTKAQYDELRKQWWKEYEAWDEELDDIMDEVIPEMDDTLTDSEEQQKKKAIEALKAIRQSWPRDVMDPNP